MPDYELTSTGNRYDCGITLRGDIAERALLSLDGCSVEASRKELMLESFAEAQLIDVDLFRTKTIPSFTDRRKLVEFGGEKLASTACKIKLDRERAEIIHFQVDRSTRNMGLGTLMMDIQMAFFTFAGVQQLRVVIGGGQPTADFLEAYGFEPSNISVQNEKLARYNGPLDSVDFDSSKITIERTEKSLVG